MELRCSSSLGVFGCVAVHYLHIVHAVVIIGVLIICAGARMQCGDRVRGRAFLLGRIAETVRLLQVRLGHNSFIRALALVSSSRMRLIASISPISIPGR